MKILKTTYYTIEFIVFYLVKLVQSNIYIAYDILTPKMHTDPCLIKVPLYLMSDFNLLVFSNLLSMIPGTLSIDMTDDKTFLEVHVLYKKDKNKMLAEIQKIQEKINRISV